MKVNIQEGGTQPPRKDKNMNTWRNRKVSVTLTNEQWSHLVCYILMTTNHRKDERNAWEELSKETNEDGTPTFTKAQENIRFWEYMDKELNEIRQIIDNRQTGKDK